MRAWARMLQLQICIAPLKQGSQGTCKSFIYSPDTCWHLPSKDNQNLQQGVYHQLLAAVSPKEPQPTMGAFWDHVSPNTTSVQEEKPPP